MKTMKKVLSSVLLACMLLSMCAVGAYAAEPDTGTAFVVGTPAAVDVSAPADSTANGGTTPVISAPGTENSANGGTAPADADTPDDADKEEPEEEKKDEPEVKFVGINGNVSMKEGETQTITVAYSPAGENIKVSFDTDSDVISVGEPVYGENFDKASVEIRAKGVGTANISCTLKRVEVVDAGISAITEGDANAVDGTEQKQEPQTIETELANTAAPLPVNVAPGISLTSGPDGATSGQMYNKSELPLTLSVTAAGFDPNGVTFASSDGNVATVDNAGKVTAVGEGKAAITASVTSGQSTLSATYNVEVIPALVPVTGVTLDRTEANIKLGGEGIQLVATVEPGNATNGAVTWESDNESNATVDETGKVTAVSVGNATITVTTVDGKFTATCVVTVSNDPVLVTGINIKDGDVVVNGTTINMKPAENKSLTAAVIPENADFKNVDWKSSAPDVVSVDDKGNIKAIGVGTATITATSTANITDPVSASVTVNVTGTLTVEPAEENIVKGGTVQLKAKFDGVEDSSKTVTWTSSNPAIASVDANGKVTGNAVGEVTITATAANYSEAKATIKIVDENTDIVVVTVDQSTITQRGGATTVRAKVGKLSSTGFVESPNVLVDNITVQYLSSATSSGGYVTRYENSNNAVFRGGFNGNYRITATYGSSVGTCDVSVRYAPAITSGNNSVFDGKNELRFIVNDSIYNFNDNVWVDGMQLTKNVHYYSVSTSDGQIGVALNPAFLNYINRSAYHTITIGDSYGNASGYFRTWGTTSTINGVKTGDDSNLALWLVLCLASAGCAAAVIVSVKKKNKNK